LSSTIDVAPVEDEQRPMPQYSARPQPLTQSNGFQPRWQAPC